MVTGSEERLRSYIRDVKDFPKPGIVFRDITTLLKDADAFKAAIDLFRKRYEGETIAKIVGIESRGFIIGGALAYALGVGYVPARKPKKLPASVLREEYKLEYGVDAIEVHVDGISKGERILVVDDLLATGGTAAATVSLVRRLGGQIVGTAFLIELTFLHGRKRLDGIDVFSLISYAHE